MAGRIPPDYRKLDPKISLLVKRLWDAGVHTYESCQGGTGHASREPFIKLYGVPADQWRALAVCQDYGFDVRTISRTWDIDNGEPSGPYTLIVFRSLPK